MRNNELGTSSTNSKVVNKEGATWGSLDQSKIFNSPSMAKEGVPFLMEDVYPIDNEPQGSHQKQKGYV
jgi:hypothetical protein